MLAVTQAYSVRAPKSDEKLAKDQAKKSSAA